jgi:EAL domain-containing protein (putative c-di-GMP-specific phosphodiesterase class I)
MSKVFLERFLSWILLEFQRLGRHPAPLVRYHLTSPDFSKSEKAARPGYSPRSEGMRRGQANPIAVERVPPGPERRAASSSNARQTAQQAVAPAVKATAAPKRPARSPRPDTISRAVTLQEVALDFLYQPKIDLRKRRLAGVEILPQIRHPAMGLMTTTVFLSQANEADRRRYSMLAIRTALSDWQALRQDGFQDGINVTFSVAVSIDLIKQPGIVELLRDARPDSENWPGLVLELPMSEVLPALPMLQPVAHALRKHNIHFALNGLRLPDVLDTMLQTLPVAEIKLWNSFVMQAQEQPILTRACRTLVDFAHALKANAVVAGLEQNDGLVFANTLGFDVGQGNLLAAPTTRASLATMLR